MTNKERIEDYKQKLNYLNKRYLCGDCMAYDIIDDLRRNFINHYENQIYFNGYHPFENPHNFNDINQTMINENKGVAVRQFDGYWYLVKIESLECGGGVLTTDCPDNYPIHCLPSEIKSGDYPEIVIMEDYFDNHKEEYNM